MSSRQTHDRLHEEHERFMRAHYDFCRDLYGELSKIPKTPPNPPFEHILRLLNPPPYAPREFYVQAVKNVQEYIIEVAIKDPGLGNRMIGMPQFVPFISPLMRNIILQNNLRDHFVEDFKKRFAPGALLGDQVAYQDPNDMEWKKKDKDRERIEDINALLVHVIKLVSFPPKDLPPGQEKAFIEFHQKLLDMLTHALKDLTTRESYQRLNDRLGEAIYHFACQGPAQKNYIMNQPLLLARVPIAKITDIESRFEVKSHEAAEDKIINFFKLVVAYPQHPLFARYIEKGIPKDPAKYDELIFEIKGHLFRVADTKGNEALKDYILKTPALSSFLSDELKKDLLKPPEAAPRDEVPDLNKHIKGFKSR